MNDKKICFLVPTYPPRFNCFNALKQSYLECNLDKQADLIAIFSNNEEKKSYQNMYGNVMSIVLPNDTTSYNERAIINIKKIYALQTLLHSQYDYACICDDDALFCKDVDLQFEFDLYFENKILISSSDEDVYIFADKARKACSRFFRNHEDFYKIKDIGLLWFNQPCIYKIKDLEKFLKVTGLNQWLAFVTYYDFDYLIYMYFLILYCDFSVVDCGVKSVISAMETTSDMKYEVSNESYKTLHVLCSTEYMWKQLNLKNVFILWHMDREAVAKKEKQMSLFSRACRKLSRFLTKFY